MAEMKGEMLSSGRTDFTGHGRDTEGSGDQGRDFREVTQRLEVLRSIGGKLRRQRKLSSQNIAFVVIVMARTGV